jgi:hypothetical protein
MKRKYDLDEQGDWREEEDTSALALVGFFVIGLSFILGMLYLFL